MKHDNGKYRISISNVSILCDITIIKYESFRINSFKYESFRIKK